MTFLRSLASLLEGTGSGPATATEADRARMQSPLRNFFMLVYLQLLYAESSEVEPLLQVIPHRGFGVLAFSFPEGSQTYLSAATLGRLRFSDIWSMLFFRQVVRFFEHFHLRYVQVFNG